MQEQIRIPNGSVAMVWNGPEGFERLSRSGSYSTPDPKAFRADWHAVRVNGIELEEWRSTAVAGVAEPMPAGPVRLDVIVGGRLQYRVGETVHAAEAGSVHLLHADRSVRFSAPGPMRVARITLLDAAMPMWLRTAPPVEDGPLPATTLTAGFVALLDRLTTTLREERVRPAQATGHAVAALCVALLEEAVPPDRADGGDLRERILVYIDRHLGDQDLGPRRIADEFDISLRWVHRVFNQDDESVARYIRERRVDAVAAAVRDERRWVRVGELAQRFGFAGRDQLTRAFKARYGATVNEYLDRVLQDGEPAAVR